METKVWSPNEGIHYNCYKRILMTTTTFILQRKNKNKLANLFYFTFQIRDNNGRGETKAFCTETQFPKVWPARGAVNDTVDEELQLTPRPSK